MSAAWSVPASEVEVLCSQSAHAVLGATLAGIADADDALTVVVSDYGRRLGLLGLRDTHPASFVQAGIAEQDQVSIATELALEGFPTFAPAYASFITGRAYDQVRVGLGIMRAPVVLVGLAAGYDSGDLGATHTSTDDVSLMRSIAGLSVISPVDNVELVGVIRELAAHPRPAYVRITGNLSQTCLHPGGYQGSIGPAECLRTGSDVALFATGSVSAAALDAAEALASHGVEASVTSVSSIEPIDADTVVAMAAAAARRLVITVEEHSTRGGLGSAVAEVLEGRGDRPALLRIGTIPGYADGAIRRDLLVEAGLDAAGIARAVSARLGIDA